MLVLNAGEGRRPDASLAYGEKIACLASTITFLQAMPDAETLVFHTA
jgi:hypothetical protein